MNQNLHQQESSSIDFKKLSSFKFIKIKSKLKAFLIFLFIILTLIWLSTISSTSSSVYSNLSETAYHKISKIYSNLPFQNNNDNQTQHSSSKSINQFNQESLKNRKFLVRDWSPWLGFNNVRYIIETGLLLAHLLNRELVLPGFSYATACEYSDDICAALTPMFIHGVPVDLKDITNRTFYPDPDQGTTILKPPVPTQNWKGWVLPLDVMLDTDHVISTWKHSIKFEDFIKLTNPDPSYHSIGMSTGKWSTDYNSKLTYRKLPNALFTNFSLTMVDKLPKPIEPLIDFKDRSKKTAPDPIIKKCESTLNRLATLSRKRSISSIQHVSSDSHQKRQNQALKEQNQFPSWDESLITGDQLTGNLSNVDHPLLEQCLASKNLRTAYGFTLAGWWMKAPYVPAKYVKPLTKMVGWWDSLHSYDEQILHIEGEIHNGFPPGSMIWTSLEGRDEYRRLVREAIRPPEIYQRIAAKLELKMRARCGGRSWVASHLRRGDFLGYEWASKDITNQWRWIENNVDYGVKLLNWNTTFLKPIHDAFNTSLEPPQAGDPLYLATNTRLDDELKFLRSKNVVLLSDLLDESDKKELGFSAYFMDTLAIVEQCLIMRAGFFYGDGHSSVAGLILNRRVFYGIDEQVTKIEYLKQPGDGQ
ncbi:hypothetical protein O181_003693 [Austropuccinia psidii MF-1]|uniref:Uncharacterized protein n=1 Tax=Austropuccinia psidii MF-1 TaxID=1389203 RepID=A0A9Q3BF64_9BASI|nr:hypothetical protein [Austropuccinia psidii MF-1]